jgi:hypothetical protein
MEPYGDWMLQLAMHEAMAAPPQTGEPAEPREEIDEPTGEGRRDAPERLSASALMLLWLALR